ncbi:MAG TPA: hypothetical protein VFC44_18395 [Candidatus Saccharimonadales bacterium]|nr:hypothetical protein [Candidatus Saccharimonadales bacterium]
MFSWARLLTGIVVLTPPSTQGWAAADDLGLVFWERADGDDVGQGFWGSTIIKVILIPSSPQNVHGALIVVYIIVYIARKNVGPGFGFSSYFRQF